MIYYFIFSLRLRLVFSVNAPIYSARYGTQLYRVCTASLYLGQVGGTVVVDMAHVVFFYLWPCRRYKQTCLPARLKCEVKQEVDQCFDYSSSSSRRVDLGGRLQSDDESPREKLPGRSGSRQSPLPPQRQHHFFPFQSPTHTYTSSTPYTVPST